MHCIPKRVHVSWPDKNILSNDHPMVQMGLARLREMNPDWKIDISDDQDVDLYLKKCLGSRDYDLIKDRHVVEKSDLWRLFKIYREGGLYVDIDRFCNRELDGMIEHNTRWVLPTCLDADFSQDIMLSYPDNPAYYEAILLAIERRRAGQRSIYFLGPQTYMHAITKSLLGRMVDSHPGPQIFQQIRKTISRMPFIQIYREHPPYDTIIYQHDPQDDITPELENWEMLKRDFYVQSGLRHWSGEW